MGKKEIIKNLRKIQLILLLTLLICQPLNVKAYHANPEEFFDLTLEQLMEVPVEVSGTLTDADRRKHPSTITTIAREEIVNSGARSIDELLDIYVPNFQILRDRFDFRHVGLRGINSERDDKYLLLVNGREMNEHSYYGALSERDLPMLSDIHHVDVIRGPGSSLYGAGAIAMVINIITEDAQTFEGTETIHRVGAIEEFYSSEIKHGKKFDDDSGLFLYAGISRYMGADAKDAPVFSSRPDKAIYRYSDPSAEYKTQIDDRRAWRNLPKLKLFSHYENGDFQAWLRYTRGGEYHATRFIDIDRGEPYGMGYQQVTALLSYQRDITDDIDIECTFSYDMFDLEMAYQDRHRYYFETHREDEYFSKVLARWNINESHSLAAGGSVSHEKFGKRSPGYPHEDPDDIVWSNMPHWTTTTVSGFAEYQWKLAPEWTMFFGSRVDNHTYTRSMFSPRYSVIHTPNEKDTYKFTYSRSVRMGHNSEMHYLKVDDGKLTDPEKIQAYEWRYERRHAENFWFGGSVFWHNYDVTGYDFGIDGGTRLGNMKTIGGEIELTYRKDKWKITGSHGYTKLLNFRTLPGVTRSYISSEPSGYGKDLANWNNHVTKLQITYKADPKLDINGSIRTYWGIPGAGDQARYMDTVLTYGDGTPSYPPVHFHHFSRPSIFVNLGLNYHISHSTSMQINGYNLLGFFDDEINKTMFGYERFNDFRSAAPAFGFTLRHTF